jgi:Zn-dependent peptidase ImmA (M78 family)
MEATASLLKKRVRNLGRRPLTEQDFYAICRRRGIFVTENGGPHMKWNGIYTELDGLPTIIIKKGLTGLERAGTMFHELGHHFLHEPKTCFADDATIEQAQYEADAFAALCLFPKSGSLVMRQLRIRVELAELFQL